MKKTNGFTGGQIALHWVSAVLVIAAYVTHDAMIAVGEAVRAGTWAGYDTVMVVHMAGGGAVIVFAFWRLGLLSRHGAPQPPDDEPLPLRIIALLTKLSLYAIMIVMPVSGVLNWFGGLALAGSVHLLMEPLVPLVVALHVLGALYQHFWLKTDVLTRMLRPAPGASGRAGD